MKSRSFYRNIIAFLGGVALLSLGHFAFAQTPPATTAPATTETTPAAPDAPPIPNDQLDALVAPIAMYADPLLAQTLAASTYPLEIIQLQQWMEKNKTLKGKALADAVAKQPWDPSIQSMVTVPDVVKRLAGNIQWTADLGNAFLAQQSDVMDAVQRMRAKAQAKGNLNSNAQQKVETRTEANKQVIVIEQADPETVYVPSYDPAVVYGPPVYPYYPYTYPGYYPGMGLAFGTGILIGAGIANGWWGNCNWGGGDININNNNNFNRNNINNSRNNISNRPGAGQGGNRWQHNGQHRGNTPYSNRKTANQFGGGNRPTQRPSNSLSSNRPNSRIPDGPSNRPSSNRPGADRGTTNRSNTSRGPSASTRPSTRPSGPNNISNRSMSSGFDRSSAFGGGGFDRGSARASSMRGGGSMRSSGFSGGSRGGGFSRGGGARGGGRRR